METSQGELPVFSLILPPVDLKGPLNMQHVLVFSTADIILKRKKMQKFEVINLMGVNHVRDKNRGNPTAEPALCPDSLQLIGGKQVNRLAAGVFIRLYHDKKIYRAEKEWFLKSSEALKPAAELIKGKKITFIPSRWEKAYYSWLGRLGDWCICQRGNGGQRLPIYHCPDCGQVTAAETKPLKCSRCQSGGLVQDEGALAPWFSHILWPFGHHGYPFTSVVCGVDSLFPWVARTVVIALLLHEEIPFRDVLIHGAIREADEPSDLIKQYGSEALRFNLAIQASPGRDISVSTSRIKGCRSFINKIWNASRYVLSHLKGDEDLAVDFLNITDADRWLMHRLNDIIERVNRLMDQYRLHKAALLLYHFVRHEYCDWYLEFSKGSLENRDTRRVLKLSLLKLLHLLHPFLPVITDEIFHTIVSPDNFLSENRFPSFDSLWVFPDEYANIEQLKKIITEIRRMQGEYGIKPRQKTILYLKTDSEKEKRRMAKYLKYFDLLTGTSESGILDSVSDAPRGFKGKYANWEIGIALSHEQDRRGELTRLAQELERTEDRIAELETPTPVTAGLKQKLQAAIRRQEKIRKTIHDLS